MTQTIDIPADRRITVPREVPIGRTIIAFTPITEQESITEKLNSYYKDHDSRLPNDIKAVNYRMLREEDW
jgi:hypothetical protein